MSERHPLPVDYARAESVWSRPITWLKLALLITCFLAIAIYALVLRPSLGKVSTRAEPIAAQSNLREIYEVLRQYAETNGDRMPPSFACLLEGPTPPDVRIFARPLGFAIPTTRRTVAEQQADLLEPTGEFCSYILATPNLRFTDLYPDTVVAYERPDGKKAAELCVAYADGSIRMLDAVQASRLLADLAAGRNRLKPARATKPQGAASSPTTAKS